MTGTRRRLDVFDAILAKNKDNINVIYAKARSKAALGQYSQAMELLTKAVSGSPKVIRVWAREEKVFQVFHSERWFRKLVKM